MNFNFTPSLLHIASVKIASYLIQDCEIARALAVVSHLPVQLNSFDHHRHEIWQLIEKTAVGKLPPLPPYLPIRVAKFIRPMYGEINSWLVSNDLPRRKDVLANYMSFLCWRSDGTIDGEQTAKKFLWNRSIDLRDKFVLACNYFLETEIFFIWENVDSWLKRSFMSKIYERRTNVAVRCWLACLKERSTKPVNEMIEEYFEMEDFSTLDIPLRLSSYFGYLPQISRLHYFDHAMLHKDDLGLCYQQMGELERMEFVQTKPVMVLKKCLEWPFESLFVKMANNLSCHLTVHDSGYILNLITKLYILYGRDYFELFKEFWNIIPVSHQDQIKKDEKRFKIYREILNSDRANRSQSFVETIGLFSGRFHGST